MWRNCLLIWEGIKLNLENVYGIKEASELWEISKSNLRNALNRYGRFDDQIKRGLAKKSGGQWIITKLAMEEVFGKMKMYKNVNNGVILNAKELAELHLREYNDMWKDKRGLADEFETKEEFIEYMKKNEIDNDFVEIEE